jgi:hypothetical protein
MTDTDTTETSDLAGLKALRTFRISQPDTWATVA